MGRELALAQAAFPPMRSKHEGLAIVEEEFLELRREVFWGGRPWWDPRGWFRRSTRDARCRTEATHLAAMALRFLIDCC